ncbi:hypothetical protein DLREEDagrD3_24810 [Denitratisoma sp. agr-D3]
MRTQVGIAHRSLVVVLGAMVIGGLAAEAALAQDVAQKNYHLVSGQTPTVLTVTNGSKKAVYANLVLGQPPTSNPPGCSNLGTQVTSVSHLSNGQPNLEFKSSVSGKKVRFVGPKGVTTKGAYRMSAGETITYVPRTFPCFSGKTCTPAMTFNFFFTDGFNGTSTGNNGCGGAGTTYPNATNLAEGSINFSANGAVGSVSGPTCANADDTDISAVNGVNATLSVNTQSHGKGAAWPKGTRIALNGLLGSNANQPGVFGWAATNCTNAQGFPNPSTQCAAPVDAPKAQNGVCPPPTTLITGPDGTQYCAQTSASGTCNNQRAAYNTGGTIKIVYKGQIAPKAVN